MFTTPVGTQLLVNVFTDRQPRHPCGDIHDMLDYTLPQLICQSSRSLTYAVTPAFEKVNNCLASIHRFMLESFTFMTFS